MFCPLFLCPRLREQHHARMCSGALLRCIAVLDLFCDTLLHIIMHCVKIKYMPASFYHMHTHPAHTHTTLHINVLPQHMGVKPTMTNLVEKYEKMKMASLTPPAWSPLKSEEVVQGHRVAVVPRSSCQPLVQIEMCI